MGERFDRLPPLLRSLHGGGAHIRAAGSARVERGRHPLAWLIAAIVGFPPAGTHMLLVGFAEHGSSERWTRDFGGHRFASELSQAGDSLVERFGPFRFGFGIDDIADGLALRMTDWSLLGVPLPLVLAPRSRAREWQADGRFHFDVALALPLIGDVVAYAGWLVPED